MPIEFSDMEAWAGSTGKPNRVPSLTEFWKACISDGQHAQVCQPSQRRSLSAPRLTAVTYLRNYATTRGLKRARKREG